ncbi:MAG: DEAD/DEAH box helicase [Verrucomicrobiota bacterium]
MGGEVSITEKFLLEAGGWKEMKAARLLHGGEHVIDASYEAGFMEGVVQDRGKAYRAKLKVGSLMDMENLCSCPAARRDGIICAHVLAVGLEIIQSHERKNVTEAVVEEVASADGGGGAEATSGRIDEGGDSGWPAVVESYREGAVPGCCHVILPLNFEGAWDKGRLTVGVEVEMEGDRRLLSAVPIGTTLFLEGPDANLMDFLRSISPDDVPGTMMLGREDFLRLLDALAGHERVAFGKKNRAVISIAPYRPALDVKGSLLKVSWPGSVVPLVGKAGAWAMSEGVFEPVAPGLPEALGAIFAEGYRLEPASGPVVLEMLAGAFEVGAACLEGLPEVVAPEVELMLEGSLNCLEMRVVFDYGFCRRAADGQAPGSEAQWEEGELEDGRRVVTDPAFERATIDALRVHGIDWSRKLKAYVIREADAILQFHAHGMARLDPRWKVTTGERFEHAAKQVVAVNPSLAFEPGGSDWFAVSMEFESAAGDTISRQDVHHLLLKGQNHQKTAGGEIAVIDAELIEDLQETIADCDPRQSQPGTFSVGRRFAAYLGEATRGREVMLSGAKPWEARAKDGAQRRREGELGELKEILRPYQREGVDWMLALDERGMGGILADDMGLGKTLQALAFLKVVGGRALVVCPSSLVHNWMNEAARFVPGLKAVAIDGPGRKETFRTEGADADILVTSYALLRRDEALYRGLEFDVMILDEAQHIKNPEAKVTKAAGRIAAGRRVALTGTPIENSVRDIWSVMNFVMPGYLGKRMDFAERFEKPITSGGGEAQALQTRLSRRLQPVVLRRLKSDVARDLPEKIEQTIYCDLSPAQRDVYGTILHESRKTILDAEGARKRMVALTALLRLRQVCCDLRLLDLPGRDLTNEMSAKLAAMEELIEEAIEGGHRVLIFSQFVQMLQVLVPMLHEKGHDYCYLDGQTKKRGEVVARFQEDESIPVFLISLKAGGVGLNLTGADTVIHVDPWWNPAVEAQATDRAHRIGQERVVTSYKLIARDTVEEKILTLQEKKAATMRAVLADGGLDAGRAGLDEEEILSLFE